MPVTVTEVTSGAVKRISFAWTSSSGGAATGSTSGSYDGKLITMQTTPAGGGSAPTDNYDITLTDDASIDVLAGAGANRDTATTEIVTSDSLGAVAGSALTLTVASAGDTKAGAVHVYIR